MKKSLLLISLFLFLGSSLFCQQWKVHSPPDSIYFGQKIQIDFDTTDTPWLASWRNNEISLFKYSSGVWSVNNIVNYVSGLPTGLVIDQNNTKWISSSSKGLYKVKDTLITRYHKGNSDLPGNTINSIALGLNNDLWIGCRDLSSSPQRNYIVRFDGTSWTVFDSSETGISDENLSTIKAIRYDPIDNRLYVVTNNFDGIFIYSDSSWNNVDTTNSSLPSGRIIDLEIDSEGHLWCVLRYPNGAFRELVKYNGTNFTAIGTPPEVQLAYFDIDSLDNLWFDVSGAYITKFDRVSWVDYTKPDEYYSISNGFYWQFVINDNQSIWMANYTNTPMVLEFNEIGQFTPVSNNDFGSEKVLVYPNPNNGEFSIESEMSGLSVEVYNISGQVIFLKQPIDSITTIDLSKYPRGMYLVKLGTKSQTIVKKIVYH